MLLKKLLRRSAWRSMGRKIFYERLTEPLHVNLISFWVALFGSFRTKVAFDLVYRRQHAFSILEAADRAQALGHSRITLIEIGVAAGEGLMNICAIAKQVTRETGVEFDIVGFDTGRGLPPPQSYRDHPEYYGHGDFPMDAERLQASLPPQCQLILGEVDLTLPQFIKSHSSESPIGFVSIDVDYYYSTRDALRLFRAPAEHFLPLFHLYFDDVESGGHNSSCGQLLAIDEFNAEFSDSSPRKIEKHAFFRYGRVYRYASWIDHMFQIHILDHPTRKWSTRPAQVQTIENAYL